MTYCNGRLSQALIVSGDCMRRPEMVDTGMRLLDWLLSVQSSPDKQFAAIGSGAYQRGEAPAIFDQRRSRPARWCLRTSMCSACTTTGDG